jgi:hypothetical protein
MRVGEYRRLAWTEVPSLDERGHRDLGHDEPRVLGDGTHRGIALAAPADLLGDRQRNDDLGCGEIEEPDETAASEEDERGGVDRRPMSQDRALASGLRDRR